MNTVTVKEIVVRKDIQIPLKPWCCDLIMSDGKVVKNALSGFDTKKDMLELLEAVEVLIEGDPEIFGGRYES